MFGDVTGQTVFAVIKGPVTPKEEAFYLCQYGGRALWDMVTDRLPCPKENTMLLSSTRGPLAERARQDGITVLDRAEPGFGARFIECIQRSGCAISVIIRIDFPFHDPNVTNMAVAAITAGAELVTTHGFPHGLAIQEACLIHRLIYAGPKKIGALDRPLNQIIAPDSNEKVIECDDAYGAMKEWRFMQFSVKKDDDLSPITDLMRRFGMIEPSVEKLKAINPKTDDNRKLVRSFLSARIDPYIAENHDRAETDIIDECQRTMLHRFSGGRIIDGEPLSYNSATSYGGLLEMLQNINSRFLTFEELFSGGGSDDQLNVVIHHDVDLDIGTALRLARIENERGIAASHFILHTAQYYGVFVDGRFHRYARMGEVYRRLQELGHEVGLHANSLKLYQVHRLNGADAARQEIRWLRKNGIRIAGSAGHSSSLVYGADNYEMFKGRARMENDDNGVSRERDQVFFKDLWAPLGELDTEDLNLLYETVDIGKLPRFAGRVAPVGRNRLCYVWTAHALKGRAALSQGFDDFDSLQTAVAALNPGEILELMIHPCYFGAAS